MICSYCDQSTTIYEKMRERWDHYKQTSFVFLLLLMYRPSLFKSMATAFGLPYLMAAGLKLIHDILQFLGPIMLQRIISYLEDEDEVDMVYILILINVLENWLNLCCHYVFCCIVPEYLFT